MRVSVERYDCIGCGLCVRRCPEVFELDNEKISRVIADPVPGNVEEEVREIANSCPTNAISIEK